jgi:NADH dehydrogenase
VIFGAEDRFLNLIAKLQAVAPVMPLAGAKTRFQPVWVEDVAEAIVRCLDAPTTVGQTIECAGPDVYTLAELVRLAGRWSGHQRPVLPLPMVAGRLQALVMELLPGEPLMSRDNLESMKVPNVASGSLPGLASLGIAPASLAQIAPGYLGHRDGRANLNALRAVARRSDA